MKTTTFLLQYVGAHYPKNMYMPYDVFGVVSIYVATLFKWRHFEIQDGHLDAQKQCCGQA
jgi:hypothetical protein